jgi:hypothetical protein
MFWVVDPKTATLSKSFIPKIEENKGALHNIIIKKGEA